MFSRPSADPTLPIHINMKVAPLISSGSSSFAGKVVTLNSTAAVE